MHHRPPHPTLINKSSPFLVGVNRGTQTGLFNPPVSCSTSLPTLISLISSLLLRRTLSGCCCAFDNVGLGRTFNGAMISSYMAGLLDHIPDCVRLLRSSLERGVVDQDSVLLLRMCVRARGGEVKGSLRGGRGTRAMSFGAFNLRGTRDSSRRGARFFWRFWSRCDVEGGLGWLRRGVGWFRRLLKLCVFLGLRGLRGTSWFDARGTLG
jgi:hypothetical protein